MKTSLSKLFLLAVFFVACNKNENSSLPAIVQSTQNATTSLPQPKHIVIVIEENHGYEQIIGSASAPYINALARNSYSVLFTKSYAVTHPSQANYLHLFSGSSQGVTNDAVPINEPFTTANLAKQLIKAGKSFATFSQGLPYTSYNGKTWGAYARKHNPVTNWMGNGTNQVPGTTNKPFAAFPSDFNKLPTVSFVIPNLNNDMHDGSISKADNWLKVHLDDYIQWAKRNNSLFILTFDEDDDKHNNHIVTIFCGPMVRSGKDTIEINHHTVLRTMEDMYGLPYAGNAATVKPITNCWK